MRFRDNEVITLYTLKDADTKLKAIRRKRRIKVVNFIADVLDRFACVVIWPLAIGSIIWIFIH